ncbi:unnamed protein product [Auanema sp. JU1783]|nr:unnamed protein product [Auanema sp. JU1783]
MLALFLIVCLCAGASAVTPVQGTRCSPNQVINRLTVYEDGALEAECGPIPCGESGARCIEDQTSCRAETDVFSGMRWAANEQSLLLRCCTLKTSNKIYVGTDLVSLGSYYQGGPVAQKDLYGTDGPEYDFIANVRIEQGGVRVWVYRIMCAAGETVPKRIQAVEPTFKPATVKEVAKQEEQEEENDDGEEEVEEEEAGEEETTQAPIEEIPFNPLRYRPPQTQRPAGARRA